MLPTARNDWSGAVRGASLVLPPTGRHLHPPARPIPPEGMAGFCDALLTAPDQLFPDMPCMNRVYRDNKASVHWSAFQELGAALVALINRLSTGYQLVVNRSSCSSKRFT